MEESDNNKITKEEDEEDFEEEDEVIGFVGGFRLANEEQRLAALGFGKEAIPPEFYPHKECFHDVPIPTVSLPFAIQ